MAKMDSRHDEAWLVASRGMAQSCAVNDRRAQTNEMLPIVALSTASDAAGARKQTTK